MVLYPQDIWITYVAYHAIRYFLVVRSLCTFEDSQAGELIQVSDYYDSLATDLASGLSFIF
jgi:hypothetical protein